MKEYLKSNLKKWNINLTDRQSEQFQIFYDTLLEKNKVMNLTSITKMEDVVIKHFMDSLSPVNYLSWEDGISVIDVGTGAGFPGIPLAIFYPNIQFTLMDSLNKRILFLQEVLEKCELENVKCVHSRAEELGHQKEHRQKYDICVSRAVASLPILLEYCMPFVKVNGFFLSYKSVLAEDELLFSERAQKILYCSLEKNISFQIPDTDFNRCLLVMKMNGVLNKKYPRQNGIPKKKPL